MIWLLTHRQSWRRFLRPNPTRIPADRSALCAARIPQPVTGTNHRLFAERQRRRYVQASGLLPVPGWCRCRSSAAAMLPVVARNELEAVAMRLEAKAGKAMLGLEAGKTRFLIAILDATWIRDWTIPQASDSMAASSSLLSCASSACCSAVFRTQRSASSSVIVMPTPHRASGRLSPAAWQPPSLPAAGRGCRARR
jgi:hypothetical protein